MELKIKPIKEIFVTQDELLDVPDEEFIELFKKKIIESDMIRISFDKNEYIEDMITNLTGGHWDLWDYNELREKDCVKKIPVPENMTLYARNPYHDIDNNPVSIDFGEKSTVVSVRDNQGHIIPIKVARNFGRDEQQYDPFENPTVLEFVDFQSFIKDYNSKEGRPNTKWNDLIVSHEAFCDITQRQYNSFMTDLISWASKEGDHLDKVYQIQDQKGYTYTFPPYLDIKEDEPDPIEYYAYYLGLYINKISNYKIYTNYVMSFPLNFSKELKRKIINSFEKGIKKSFPTALLNDERFKSRLKRGLVKEGMSKPSAYAVTALEKYGIKDKILDEEIDNFHYAVFDFGDCSTNFDFGIYRANDGSEYDLEDYDSILTHFGSHGIKNLGGEKLIKYLTFELFKQNAKDFQLMDSNILFTDYDGCTAPEKFGYEKYIKPDSLHAMSNMHEVMEKLRWIWEDPNNSDSEINAEMIEDQQFYLALYDENHLYDEICHRKDAEVRQLISFQFDQIAFQKLLAKKLQQGIEQFLYDLLFAFKESGKDLENVDTISIFLAGNSSKSILFNQLLSKYFGDDYVIDYASALSLQNCRSELREEIEEILETVDDSIVKEIKQRLGNPDLRFLIYPPLRTKEAKAIIDEVNPDYEYEKYDINDKLEPSGKTAVAYGLLASSRVKEVYLQQPENDNSVKFDVPFQFDVGKSIKGRFKPVLYRKAPMLEWSKDCLFKTKNDKDTYIFYYTTSAEADSGYMKIQAGKQQILPFVLDDPKDDEYIYIRPITQNEIEWQIVSDVKDLRSKDNIDTNSCIILDID